MNVRRIAIVAGSLLSVYILIGLVFDGLIGYYQPQDQTTLVIQTQDEGGEWIDTVLTARDHEGELWVESGHWFRGWYKRLLVSPQVHIIRDGERRAYVAVPVNTEEAVELMTRLMGKGQGSRYWVFRALLLFAPIKPVFLMPIENEKVGRL